MYIFHHLLTSYPNIYLVIKNRISTAQKTPFLHSKKQNLFATTPPNYKKLTDHTSSMYGPNAVLKLAAVTTLWRKKIKNDDVFLQAKQPSGT
jgi:hypothetical protein